MSIAIPVLAAAIVTIRGRPVRRPPPQRTVASHPGSGTRRRDFGNRHPGEGGTRYDPATWWSRRCFPFRIEHGMRVPPSDW